MQFNSHTILEVLQPVIVSKSSSINFSKPHRLCTQLEEHNLRDIFLCYKGVKFDPHHELSRLKSPCLTILEHVPENYPHPWIQVQSSRLAWSLLAANYFGNPQKELNFIGVTGTNGKTSTVWFIREIAKAHGIEIATLGTLGCYYNGKHIPLKHTTPDPPELFSLLNDIRQSNIQHVAMEVSSIALDQQKVHGIAFSNVGFTSFSQDHLDYHPSMQSYWEAKTILFEKLRTGNGYVHKSVSLEGYEKYGLECKPIFQDGYMSFTQNIQGMTHHFKIKTLGDHFAENAILATIFCKNIFSLDSTIQIDNPVPGRMEIVSPQIIVDYAHTPDALSKALGALRPYCKERLFTVFGCGGDRDRGKRSLMGQIACQLADEIILTNDNPRKEDPEDIINDILKGINREITLELDRKKAIKIAISKMTKNDILLVAGKGAENYMEIGTNRLPFHDPSIVLELIKENS